jgi:hypothetical protein
MAGLRDSETGLSVGMSTKRSRAIFAPYDDGGTDVL